MSREEIIVILKEAFVEVLEHSNFELKNETTANDVDGWESITHMMIINELEKKFQIKFKLMDLMDMEEIGDMINTIEKEVNNK